MSIAIKVENLSKLYRLGEVGTGTLSHDLNRFWHKIRGKEDPYTKLGTVNDRTRGNESNYVWSLKDIDFSLEQGKALGIIGKNGAGKSTLLKLLSRVTSPTTGCIKVKGRIASLLEVGTGFHPEMTGRENIFLNGAILGMSKKEIKTKFDEIVHFSGVEKYIDTPVKRYSSGMYVRLAFAVAAHLESEILIVDEVLAVGDSEFQKKCLGKMNEVSKGQGRTVLFVSHNMAAVKDLCSEGILLKNGQLQMQGPALEAVAAYQKMNVLGQSYQFLHDEIKHQNQWIKIDSFSAKAAQGDIISIHSGIQIDLLFTNNRESTNIDATFELRTLDEIAVFHTGVILSQHNDSKKGQYAVSFEIPPHLLNAGQYYFKLIFGENQKYPLYIAEQIISFEVQNVNIGANSALLPGIVRPHFHYHTNFQSL